MGKCYGNTVAADFLNVSFGRVQHALYNFWLFASPLNPFGPNLSIFGTIRFANYFSLQCFEKTNGEYRKFLEEFWSISSQYSFYMLAV